jgi:hypothetical protein
LSLVSKAVTTLVTCGKGCHNTRHSWGVCSTMKSWSIFHVYSTVTSTDVRYWILALPMRDIRATDVTHWILALPMRDIRATDIDLL